MNSFFKWLTLLTCISIFGCSEAQVSNESWEIDDFMRVIPAPELVSGGVHYQEEIICFWRYRPPSYNQLWGVVLDTRNVGRAEFDNSVVSEDLVGIAIASVFANCNNPINISPYYGHENPQAMQVPRFRDDPLWSFYQLELSEDRGDFDWGIDVYELAQRLGHPIQASCLHERTIFIALSNLEPSPWRNNELHFLNVHWRVLNAERTGEMWQTVTSDGIENCRAEN
ncbi:hypothetical protein [Ponticaulis koreensis]|uniref:hypothetical protein n=1 Tax=Ponticaulis koreensis TaxID=1123045 RepID=UPI0003B602D1|nr:hypothetical protein [Ponticaulis koreensis]